ncbi:hypothetical protein AVEN_198523-1 [Araneus ventricosus]|uniref:Helitron helicase-like domain-containing protein n=1 Tax=Araneus ventricosus TaxID=182803 RepID=A0A4Y2LT06_ARAVE|nr:hypothetical protein AVEN_198523-1 [Araneus ventricosus]
MQLQSNDCLLNNDEILTFLDGRYVSAPEAMWRLNEFSLSEKSHVIMRLAVHLPNKQQVVFKSGQEVAAVAGASMRHTTLSAWFLLVQQNVEAHNYNYADVPQYNVFDKCQTLWKRRKRGEQQIIGRIKFRYITCGTNTYMYKPGIIFSKYLNIILKFIEDENFSWIIKKQ